MGYDLGYKTNYDYIQEKVASYFDKLHKVGSIINGSEVMISKHARESFCPATVAENGLSVSESPFIKSFPSMLESVSGFVFSSCTVAPTDLN